MKRCGNVCDSPCNLPGHVTGVAQGAGRIKVTGAAYERQRAGRGTEIVSERCG